MPSLVGTAAATNYLKTSPSSQFGTRKLLYLQINAGTDVGTNYQNSDSNYSKAVRALQTVCEVYALGIPNSTDFTAIVAYDTTPLEANQQPEDEDRINTIEAVLNDALGTTTNVFNGRLRGWNIENNC